MLLDVSRCQDNFVLYSYLLQKQTPISINITRAIRIQATTNPARTPVNK